MKLSLLLFIATLLLTSFLLFADEEARDAEDIDFSDSLFSDSMIDESPIEDSGDSLFDIDFDDMFEETGEMVEEVDLTQQNLAPAEDLLLNEAGIEWGGRFAGSLDTTFRWIELWTNKFTLLQTESETFVPHADVDLFFDARPVTDVRILGKLRIRGEAEQDFAELFGGFAGGGVTAGDDGTFVFTPEEQETEEEEEEEDEDTVGGAIQYQITVRELFGDFSWEDVLFFRFGKSFIKWGVGFFWSPADILNLSQIDVENPTAEREGPINFKLHYPFDVHNVYLYIIGNNEMAPKDIAAAGSVELLVAETELGFGGFFQRNQSPRIVATVSSVFRDFDLIGEAVLSWGSDRTYVREAWDQDAAEEDPDDDFTVALETFEIADRPFFNGTVGILYQNADWNLSSILQYFFNGEGYRSSDLLKAAVYLNQNPGTNALALPEEEQPEGYKAPPELAATDINNWGQHYLGLSVSLSEFMDSDFSASVQSIVNLSDLSGFLNLSISVTFLDTFTLSTGPRLSFGDPGDEWTNQANLYGQSDYDGPTLDWSLNVSMGSGSF